MKGENDSLLKKYKIFFGFLSKIKFINNITHIKLKLCDVDNQINGIHLNKENFNVVYFNNFFKNINHLEIEKITNSLCFINKLITYANNSINNVTKINLSDINIKMNNEEIIDYNIYNSLSFPELTKLKYLSLVKVNLSVFCLNEIISKNCNLIRIVVLHCSNNNISLYDEKEYAKLLNKSIKNCKELNYVNFNKNNFSIYLINQIVYIFIEIFFKSDKIYFINCEYPINNEKNDGKNCIFEFPKHLKECTNIVNKNDFNKYLTIKFNPSLSYSIKKNKCIVEVSDLQNEKPIKGINFEKIKLALDNSYYQLNSNKLKKIMRQFYQKGITKYFQIFWSCPKRALMNTIKIHKNNDEKYESIEKVTIYFEDEGETLFGDRIILKILSFFPCVKIISFKNVYFEKDKIELFELSDIIELFHNKNDKNQENNKKDCFEFVLFGDKNKDLDLFKNEESCLREIRFNNCRFHHCLIGKDITQHIEKTIKSYLGKNDIRIIYVE